MAKISKNKKIVATATGILVGISLAVGGVLINNKPVVKPILDLAESPIITPVATATPKPSTVPNKIIAPTKSPAPSKTPKPTATPKHTNSPKVLEVTKVTPAPVDTFTLFGISGKINVDGSYTIKKIDKNKSEFSIAVPDKLSADMYELYLNRQFVDKQLLPNGKIIAPPLLFTATELLEVRVIKLQKVIAIGRFKDGKLNISVKDGVIND